MVLIRELSAGVADSYRLQKKSKIQRTFVKASDAAEAKVTRKRPSYGSNAGNSDGSKKLKPDNHGNSGAFILVNYHAEESPLSQLLCSAAFCKVSVEFKSVTEDASGVVCTCEVGGDEVSRETGAGFLAARKLAAAAALEVLRQRCYLIRFKARVVSEEEVARAELATQQGEARVETSSVGGKLLAMMGWDGGGLGRQGQGITEPVRVEDVAVRAGFGSAGRAITRQFKDGLRRRLQNYASRFQERDLSFSSDFTIEERKEVHQMARRLGLKSRSYGKEDDRFLVVSHKFNPYHLLRHLIESGGVTDKYELVPPSKAADK